MNISTLIQKIVGESFNGSMPYKERLWTPFSDRL